MKKLFVQLDLRKGRDTGKIRLPGLFEGEHTKGYSTMRRYDHIILNILHYRCINIQYLVNGFSSNFRIK